MRNRTAWSSATLVVVIMIVLGFVCAQLVLPGPAYSRQIAIGSEDGGDPDEPDGVTSVSDRFGGLISAPEVRGQDEGGNSQILVAPDSPHCLVFRLLGVNTEHRTLVLKIWFSVASSALTF